MNILMISDVYFPRVNGVSTSIATFRKQLMQQGHQVCLIVPDYQQDSIDDPDIKTFADLNRYYPLPDGFVYGQTAEGVPVVERQTDGETFYFLIEEELMGFDLPLTRPDGTPGKKTIEIIKK